MSRRLPIILDKQTKRANLNKLWDCRDSNATGIVKHTEPNVTSIVKQIGPNAHGIVKETESLSSRLMEIAGYNNISATALMIKVGRLSLTNNHSIPQYTPEAGTCESYQDNLDSDTVKKVYIPVYLNRRRIVGCMDSGSDITILHKSMYDRIYEHQHRELIKSDIPHITTFSDNRVPILGKLHTFVQLSLFQPGLLVTIYVVQDIPNVPVFLIGNDVFKAGLVTLAYTGDLKNPYPEIIFKNPTEFQCPVYYESSLDLFSCYADCILSPFETQDVIMRLPRAAPIISTDHILITSNKWDKILITPSRSDVELVSNTDYFVATAQVTNLTNAPFSGTIIGKYELINTAKIVNFDGVSSHLIHATLKEHPLARELLSHSCKDAQIYPHFMVNQISTDLSENTPVSDLDYADIIMDKEPTYFGEANIEPEIIEAKGLDLPTRVYSNAEEAIDLNSFNDDVRPFIKDIFIN